MGQKFVVGNKMITVLFVCVHNAGRSQMAEAIFNRLAAGKAIAISAGTAPADKVNPVVIEAMKEIGFDISQNKPKKMTVAMIEKADRMITMGCGDNAGGLCPAGFIETEDWLLEDPAGKSIESVRRIRDEIEKKVKSLIAQLGIK